MLKAGKLEPKSGATRNDVNNILIETGDAICERPDNTQNLPDKSDGNCQWGFMGTSYSVIQERTKDLDLAPGSVVDGVNIVTLGDSMDKSERAPNL